MFLSRLLLDPRHHRTRSEFDHPYELHRTLCKAWPDPDAARILFRPELERGVARVIVQSQTPPDWTRLTADHVTQTDGPKQIDLDGLTQGRRLAFRLRCRPSHRVGEPGSPEEGKRKSLKDRGAIFDWLQRKADANGFRVEAAGFDRVYWYDSKEGKDPKPLGGVQFDGILVVDDPDKLKEAVANGIGPQKAFGFGLLSLAPV